MLGVAELLIVLLKVVIHGLVCLLVELLSVTLASIDYFVELGVI